MHGVQVASLLRCRGQAKGGTAGDESTRCSRRRSSRHWTHRVGLCSLLLPCQCQKADWKAHKVQCKEVQAKKLADAEAEKSGALKKDAKPEPTASAAASSAAAASSSSSAPAPMVSAQPTTPAPSVEVKSEAKAAEPAVVVDASALD